MKKKHEKKEPMAKAKVVSDMGKGGPPLSESYVGASHHTMGAHKGKKKK